MIANSIKNKIIFKQKFDFIFDIAIVIILFPISLILVNPLGNFPLNDDWSFGLTVKNFIMTGQYHPTGWAAMPLITNVMWGSLFSVLLGYSYDALRLSTLFLSLLGTIFTYALVRDLSHSRFLAIMMALTLAFNPIYYALSNTFMTDVPFSSLTIIASFFFVRHLKTGSQWAFFVATLVIVIATMSRQLGMSVAIGFGVALFLNKGLKIRVAIYALFPLFVCIISLTIFQDWLVSNGNLPALYNQKNNQLIDVLMNPLDNFTQIVKNAYAAILYIGFFLSPILLVTYTAVSKLYPKKASIIFLVSLILVFSTIIWEFQLMPVRGNILINSGIGPLVLHDTYVLGLNHVPVLSEFFWFTVTIASMVGAGLLIFTVILVILNFSKNFSFGRVNYYQASFLFLFTSAAIQLAPLVMTSFFDRYLIPIMALTGIAISALYSPLFSASSTLECSKKFRSNQRDIIITTSKIDSFKNNLFGIIAVILIFSISLFSIAATKDYFAWNRARWHALEIMLSEESINSRDIDGGFEFNGLNFYDPEYKRSHGKSWWWVQNNEYILAFGPVPNYDIYSSYVFDRWMPPGIGYVYILKKSSSSVRQ